MRGLKIAEIKTKIMSAFQELFFYDFNTPMLEKKMYFFGLLL
jgi:hypothetical protein